MINSETETPAEGDDEPTDWVYIQHDKDEVRKLKNALHCAMIFISDHIPDETASGETIINYRAYIEAVDNLPKEYK